MNSADVATVIESVLTTQKISHLTPEQMPVLLHHVFHRASTPQRIQVAEVVFRHERANANASCAMRCSLIRASEICRRLQVRTRGAASKKSCLTFEVGQTNPQDRPMMHC